MDRTKEEAAGFGLKSGLVGFGAWGLDSGLQRFVGASPMFAWAIYGPAAATMKGTLAGEIGGEASLRANLQEILLPSYKRGIPEIIIYL